MKVVNQSVRPSKNKKRTIKNAEYPTVESALYEWCVRQRDLNLPVSNDILKQKTIQLHERLRNLL